MGFSQIQKQDISHLTDNFLHYFILFLVLPFASISSQAALTIPKAPKNSIPAILVFGDSTVDPGNNNYVATIFKGNFPPYGQDFVNQEPTGRFSNGKLPTDIIAAYVGVKESVPPYLDPTLSIEELMTGVSFASAGTGFDPLTPQISNVISMSKELEYFKEYKKKLAAAMGKQKAEQHVKKSLVVLSCGTNDFVVNYFTLPIRPKTFSISQYQRFILDKKMQFIQGLFDLGARRIMVTGLSAIGCLPVVITLFSKDAFGDRKCLDHYSTIGKQFNAMLQAELTKMQDRLAHQGARIILSDPYDSFLMMLKSPQFDKVSSGCCGTGYLEAGILCNPHTYVCPNPYRYIFWDSIHPTEQVYFNIIMEARPILDYLIKD